MSNNEMVSVPREPTPEMLAASLKADGNLNKWYAMVAAAPAAKPQGEKPRGSGSLEFDKLLAEYHAIVWASAEDGDCDYDMAGVDVAKKLQAMFLARGGQSQGEPVFQVCDGVNGWIDVDLLRYTACCLDPEEYEVRTLYASPPAPEAVVLPAGGEPKVLGYSVKGNRYAIRLTKGELLELCESYTGDALIELVDRSHLSLLQAEVEKFKAANAKLSASNVRRRDREIATRKELAALKAAQGDIRPIAYMRNEGTPNNLVKCTFTCPGAFGVYRYPAQSQGEPVAVALTDEQILEAMADHGSPNDERGTSSYDERQTLAAGRAVLACLNPKVAP